MTIGVLTQISPSSPAGRSSPASLRMAMVTWVCGRPLEPGFSVCISAESAVIMPVSVVP